MKILIVESPNKTQKIKKLLGDDFEVLASYGHIRDLPVKKFGIDIKNNFTPQYALMPDKVQILQNILDMAAKAEKIYLSPDPDREGAGIAYSLYHYLKPLNKPIKRVVFREITQKGIDEGLANERDVEEETNLVAAFSTRRCMDRIVGYLASPLLIKYFGSNLSAGRVQSVAVRLIVEKEREIENFKPKEFHNIFSSFIRENAENFIAKLDVKINNQELANQYVEQIKTEPGFIVSEIKASKKLEKPSAPLITITLQQYMARRYGFGADQTMKAAVGLFERGLCTYPRTDSTRIAEERIEEARKFLTDKFPLPKKGIQYSSEKSQADAHEALAPTVISTTPTDMYGSRDEKLVYKAIWEYFLASQLTPAVWNTLQVKIYGIQNKKLIFKLSGKALEDPGYLAIFGSIEKGKIEIPLLKQDELLKINPEKIKSEKKFTQPPTRFNDASILKDLEKRGIGRPSTYASILKSIAGRNYVEKNGSTFIPTAKGREITAILKKYFEKGFMDFGFTAQYEEKLDLIAAGKLTSLEVLREFYQEFKEQLDFAYREQENGTGK